MENSSGIEIGPLYGMRELDTDRCRGFTDPYKAVFCSGF
jgi:hypothetical protein